MYCVYLVNTIDIVRSNTLIRYFFLCACESRSSTVNLPAIIPIHIVSLVMSHTNSNIMKRLKCVHIFVFYVSSSSMALFRPTVFNTLSNPNYQYWNAYKLKLPTWESNSLSLIDNNFCAINIFLKGIDKINEWKKESVAAVLTRIYVYNS